jgi:hypothetical protein
MRVTRRPLRICDGVLALVWSPVVCEVGGCNWLLGVRMDGSKKFGS